MGSDGYQGIGEAFDAFMKFLFAVVIISVPLAIWKLVEICLWVGKHIHLGWW